MANTKTQNKEQLTAAEPKGEAEKIKVKDVDLNQFITVKNGSQGKLVYKSPRTGEKYVWEDLGAEQELELRELRAAKASGNGKKFFTNNWFMFDDDWVIDFLGVQQYYKNAVRLDDFDEFLKQPASSLKKAVKELSAGQRRSIAYRAAQMISNGEIDSLKTIRALEDALGVGLLEE